MSYDPERITFFAKTDARGKNVPFGIKAKDRTRHVYVIGKTGMGKSTLLENMAVQDIKNGEGFAFIDPHGQTAETLLDYIPEERIKDVLYFAPHDMEHPVSFNIMEDVGADKRHLVVSGLMSVFKKIWVDAWSARMEYILSNTLLALLEYPDSTLLGVNRMLSDKKYREQVVANVSDPSVRSFWVDEFAKYNERYMQEAGDAIKNKIGQFTANPVIRNIVGQPKSSFDIRKIMDEKKILIMNLSKGLIGETNANLLGSMLTTRIYLAAMSRADLSPMEMQQMPNFYFYVDEFQSFANATFANILSEARKYKLNLTIAHQYIEQMEEDVRNAVFGNVGTTISFRVGPFDAEILETIFAPKFLAVDICNLGFAQVYLTLMIDGIGSSPFSAVTLEPIKHQGNSYKQMLIAESRNQFGKARQEVEEAIVAWHATVPNTKENKESAPAKEINYNSQGQRVTSQESNHKPAVSKETSNYKGSNSGASRTDYKKKDNEFKKEIKPIIPRSEPVRTVVEMTKVQEVQEVKEAIDIKPVPASGKSNYESKTKEPPSRSLEDLRSVLKNLAKTETKDVTPKNNISQVSKFDDKNAKLESSKKPQSDLRSVLAEIVSQVTKESEPQSTISEPIKVGAKSSSVDTEKNIENKVDIPSMVVTEDVIIQSSALPLTEPVKADKLDPKHLERLMRVGVNEKTPLK